MRLNAILILTALPIFNTGWLQAEQPPSTASSGDLCAEEAKDGFVRLFDGKILSGWQGSIGGYLIEDDCLICKERGGGILLTKKEYADFVLRFEFKLPPGGNNGVALRVPPEGNPAYVGMEIQILDDSSPRYKDLAPYQFHGSIYGVVPAKRGQLKPVGQWNCQEIHAKGGHIKVTLNGTVIVEADLDKIDSAPHPGLHRAKGHLGFCGHGSRVAFRNIRLKEL